MGIIAKLVTALVAAVFLAVLREVGVLGAVVDSLISFGSSLIDSYIAFALLEVV